MSPSLYPGIYATFYLLISNNLLDQELQEAQLLEQVVEDRMGQVYLLNLVSPTETFGSH